MNETVNDELPGKQRTRYSNKYSANRWKMEMDDDDRRTNNRRISEKYLFTVYATLLKFT